MAADVQLEVAQRVGHRLEVAHLTGDVEDDVGVAQQRRDRVAVADAGDGDGDVGGGAGEVAPVAAVLGHEGVDHGDAGAAGGERRARGSSR